MIPGRPWMKKHGVLLDIINDSITFSPEYSPHLGTPLFPISFKLIEVTKTIPEAIEEDIVPNRILKRGSAENLDNFLKTTEKISKKKRRLANASEIKYE